MPFPSSDPLTDLAHAPSFRAVAIRRFATEPLRRYCAGFGLCDGDCLRSYGGTTTHLLVETATGEGLVIARALAERIIVEVREERG